MSLGTPVFGDATASPSVYVTKDNPAIPFNPAVYQPPSYKPPSNPFSISTGPGGIAGWVAGGGLDSATNPSTDLLPNWQLIQAGNATDQAAQQQTRDYIQHVIDNYNKSRGISLAELQNSAGASGARNALSLQQNQVQQDALGRQIPLINQLQGFRAGQYANEDQYLKGLSAFANSDYNREDEFLKQQQGFAGKTRDIGLADAQAQADQTNEQQQQDAIARGAFLTSGHREDISNTASALLHQQQTIGNTYDQSLAGINKTRGDAASTRDQTLATVNKQWNDNYYTRLADAATTEEQRNAVRDNQKTLELSAQQLGVTAGELGKSLQLGIDKFNLGNDLSVDQIMTGLNSKDSSEQQASIALIQKMIGS